MCVYAKALFSLLFFIYLAGISSAAISFPAASDKMMTSPVLSSTSFLRNDPSCDATSSNHTRRRTKANEKVRKYKGDNNTHTGGGRNARRDVAAGRRLIQAKLEV